MAFSFSSNYTLLSILVLTIIGRSFHCFYGRCDSSCVNARDISPTLYNRPVPVWCGGGGGTPILAGKEYLILAGDTHPPPRQDLGQDFRQDWGYPLPESTWDQSLGYLPPPVGRTDGKHYLLTSFGMQVVTTSYLLWLLELEDFSTTYSISKSWFQSSKAIIYFEPIHTRK